MAPAFDAYLDTDDLNFHKRVEELYDLLPLGGHRKLRLKHLSIILLNALPCFIYGYPVFRYSRCNNYWTELSHCGVNPWELSTIVDDVVDALVDEGYLVKYLGKEGKHQQTRIEPTTKLRDWFENSRLLYNHVVRHNDFAYIRRAEKYDPEDGERFYAAIVDCQSRYRKNISIREMVNPLKEYNAFLSQQHLMIPPSAAKELSWIPRFNIDCTVYRIFSHRSELHGGRFYGGWWMGIPKHCRKAILINGLPTVELDYKSQHAYFVYGLAGLNLKETIGRDDPYSIPKGDGTDYPRSLGKLVFTISLNNESRCGLRKTVLNALREHEKSKCREKNGLAKTLMPLVMDKEYFTAFLKAFDTFHHAILNRFHQSAWKELMFKDSEVCFYILKTMTSQGIPCLSVHDSFIVPEEHKETLRAVMKDAYINLGYDGCLPPID